MIDACLRVAESRGLKKIAMSLRTAEEAKQQLLELRLAQYRKMIAVIDAIKLSDDENTFHDILKAFDDLQDNYDKTLIVEICLNHHEIERSKNGLDNQDK
jgi:acetolactate synthase regulatory subunit